jgi:hypothetical protein
MLQSIHMAVIAYPFYPNKLGVQNPPLIEDLIELEANGHHDCVTQIINMIADLKINGTESRYLKKMRGAFLELKTASRGGDKGGARVYLFKTAKETFYLCRAECKQGNEADAVLLYNTLEILQAFLNQQALFPKRGQL